MAELTNAELAERLEAVRGYLAKIAEAFLLGQSATLLRVYGPANDGDAAQVFFEAAEAAGRLRKPLQFRWDEDEAQTYGECWLGKQMHGYVSVCDDGNVEAHEWDGDGLAILISDADSICRWPWDRAKAVLEAHITSQVTGGGR